MRRTLFSIAMCAGLLFLVGCPAQSVMDLAWNPDPTATEFDVYRETGGATVATRIATVAAPVSPATRPTYVDKTVTKKLTYTYYVIARNAAGSAAPSQPVTATAK